MNKMKSKGITCFVIGHVTKDGQIAGPKLLEHMVDTVVYFEGEGLGEHRILRAVKNRYGNAREVGLFVMNEKGLSGVSNPIECFAGIHEAPMEGRSLTTIVEGSRVLLIEVQGLVLENKFSQGRRVSQGVEATRLSLLLAVMEKQMGIPFSMSDVFLNIVGGLKVDDRSADLAIMAALWSSLNQLKIDCKTAFIGEMGLNGEVRAGKQIEHRLREAQRAGLSTIFVAASVAKKFKLKTTVNLIGIESIPDLKENLFNR
jgi:DNA repair protein RadA/Sms